MYFLDITKLNAQNANVQDNVDNHFTDCFRSIFERNDFHIKQHKLLKINFQYLYNQISDSYTANFNNFQKLHKKYLYV